MKIYRIHYYSTVGGLIFLSSSTFSQSFFTLYLSMFVVKTKRMVYPKRKRSTMAIKRKTMKSSWIKMTKNKRDMKKTAMMIMIALIPSSIVDLYRSAIR